MRIAKPILSGALALSVLTGCVSRPSEGFLDLVRKDRAGSPPPEITVRLGRAIEERAFAGEQDSGLRKVMETLGNKIGFRIEASTSGTRYLPLTRYTPVDVKDPVLPGLAVTREGDLVRIRPDYRKEVIIDAATTPKEGFERMMATYTSSQEKAGAEAVMALLGDRDAKGTVAKLESMDQETRKRKALAFEANVERVRKDNGYARAWFVTYRLRHATALPAESPFWALAEALGRVRAKDVIERNPAYLGTSAFWTGRGKQDTKSTLTTYSVVAFQDRDGGLAKTEAWPIFKGE